MPELEASKSEEDSCLNCGHALLHDHSFCSLCGQKRQPLKRTIRTILEDAWESTVAIDSKLVRTISNLLIRPGKLTKEYLEGRRVSYLKPASLFLLSAALLFLSIEWTSLTQQSTDVTEITSKYVSLSILPGFSFSVTGEQYEQIRTAEDDELSGILFGEKIQENSFEQKIVVKAMKLIREDGVLALRQKVSDVASKTVFLLVPIMALLIMGLHIRRKLYFADAIIFCLHFHSAAFLMYLLLVATPSERLRGFLAFALVLFFFWYTACSLKTAFGNSWIAATMKTGLLLLTHGLIVVVLTTGLIISVLLTN
ncbi:MAG: DUF3667 domain-containing protein [Planctomycetota bacterium]